MNDETKLIIGERCSGKTTALIRESSETGYTIACMTHTLAKDIMNKAKEMGLTIPEPIVLNGKSIKNEELHNMIKNTKGILIDDFGYIINDILDGKYAGSTADSLWIRDIEVLGGSPDKTCFMRK